MGPPQDIICQDDEFPHYVAFGVDIEVEVIESVFSGSDKCRFRYKIPEKFR